MRFLIIFLLPLFLFATHKVALVIGNSNYIQSPLKNPINDAKDMSATLKSLGFDTVDGYNVTGDEFYTKIDSFLSKLTKDSIALVYYSGHGVQINNNNYLIPIDAETKVEYKSVALNNILYSLKEKNTKLNIIILDACRNNPYSYTRGAKGLAKIKKELTRNMYIAYSTEAGSIAEDNPNERNGIYTKYLLKHITTPNLELTQVFQKVRKDVREATNGRQETEDINKKIIDFYFYDKPIAVANTTVQIPKQIEQKSTTNGINISEDELFTYKEAKRDGSFNMLNIYLIEYPNGYYVSEIKELLKAKANSNQTEYYNEKKQKNSIEAYKEYIQRYPNGIYVTQAKESINNLHKSIYDKLLYKEDFDRYIKNYPDSKYIKFAKIKMLKAQSIGIYKDPITYMTWYTKHSKKKMGWYEAKQYCNNLKINDMQWRLPNSQELSELCSINPIQASNRFYYKLKEPFIENINHQDRDYNVWSSTLYRDNSGSWMIKYKDGIPYFNYKDSNNYVLCVENK